MAEEEEGTLFLDVKEIRDFFFISFCSQFWLSVLLSHHWKSVSEFGRFKSGRATTITATLAIIITFFSHLFIFITTKEKEETKSFKKKEEKVLLLLLLFMLNHMNHNNKVFTSKNHNKQQQTTNLFPHHFCLQKKNPKKS